MCWWFTMNFMEAVQAMKEGKKIRRNAWVNTEVFLIDTGGRITDPLSVYNYSISDFEATDWVAYTEDEDWSLTQNLYSTSLHKFYLMEDVKKCRDLILKDLSYLPTYSVSNIIENRFGDLEWE